MKKRAGLIISIIVIALVVYLLAWRFWPQSFADMISVDETSITSISAGATIHHFEGTQTTTDMYRIDSTEQQGDEFGEIADILAISSYQQDFRNWLPWDLDYVEADKNYEGRTVTLGLSVGNQKDEYVQIQFMSRSLVVVSSGDKSGFRVYHPSKPETMDQLVEYLETHGVKQ